MICQCNLSITVLPWCECALLYHLIPARTKYVDIKFIFLYIDNHQIQSTKIVKGQEKCDEVRSKRKIGESVVTQEMHGDVSRMAPVETASYTSTGEQVIMVQKRMVQMYFMSVFVCLTVKVIKRSRHVKQEV